MPTKLLLKIVQLGTMYIETESMLFGRLSVWESERMMRPRCLGRSVHSRTRVKTRVHVVRNYFSLLSYRP